MRNAVTDFQPILVEASYAYYKYIIGLIKVYLVVGTLNSIGLLLLGVPHAILFGMLTATALTFNHHFIHHQRPANIRCDQGCQGCTLGKFNYKIDAGNRLISN